MALKFLKKKALQYSEYTMQYALCSVQYLQSHGSSRAPRIPLAASLPITATILKSIGDGISASLGPPPVFFISLQYLATLGFADSFRSLHFLITFSTSLKVPDKLTALICWKDKISDAKSHWNETLINMRAGNIFDFVFLQGESQRCRIRIRLGLGKVFNLLHLILRTETNFWVGCLAKL